MNKKNILITGANGQLGREMRKVLDNDIFVNAIYTDVEELDITDAAAIDACIESNKVEYIVNCAAYTAVDAAESNVELCTKLNVEAPTLLAQAAHKHGAKLIHISTDYVFDGTSCRPYREDDKICPTSVYGSTKADGEKHIMDVAPESIIIRTAWLYSPHGKNFVKTMIELGRSRETLRVVSDQVGTPTNALDLASVIKTFIDCDEWHSGIYHFSNEGAISWYDFTMAIHRIAGITTCHVLPCMTEDYPTAATRPHYSVLDKSKIKATLGIEIPYWEESLEQCIFSMHNN
ncbi:MAG: dTDP-4-dehydrorhamnose reductase [Muribaculaceae bacterium]|nr:dTDP-4-dehydrorhamnose reductase [Muribaculaceae bacterium]